MARSLPQILAKSIEAGMAAWPGPFLPRIRELATEFGASPVSVLRALDLLEAKDLIVRHPRRRVRKAMPSQSKVEKRSVPVLPPAERLYDGLRNRLYQGEIRSGEPLPKLGWLARTEGVAVSTIRTVYRRLEEEKLVYRRGRAFLAGLRPEPILKADHRPWMALVMEKLYSWQSLCQSQRLAAFGQVFDEEAQRAGIRFFPVLLNPDSRPGAPDRVEGLGPFRERVRSLGKLYLGALLIEPRHRMPDLSPWLAELKQSGRPTVWLDSNNEGWPGDHRSRSDLFRLAPREGFSEAVALEWVADHGHRRVAFIGRFQQDWEVERLRLLHQAPAVQSGRLEIMEIRIPGGDDWKPPLSASLADAVERLGKGPFSLACKAIESLWASRDDLIRACTDSDRTGLCEEETREKLSPAGLVALVTRASEAGVYLGGVQMDVKEKMRVIWAALAMGPAIEGGATVIVAPNDLQARSLILNWAGSLEIKIPEDLSLISFDNLKDHFFNRLDSVDSGFGELGYRAFHLLKGDLPYQSPHHAPRTITARPFVVARGSVGALPP